MLHSTVANVTVVAAAGVIKIRYIQHLSPILVMKGTYEKKEFSVLVVEDDQDLRSTISLLLQGRQYEVISVATVLEADRIIFTKPPDLVLLDWMLPGMNGLSWLRQLRRRKFKGAVILLTARASDADKEEGLESGVDDYVTKPFSNRELLARIAAVLRRRRQGDSYVGNIDDACADEQVSKIFGLVLDRSVYEAEYMGKRIVLSNKEFALLEFFINHPDKVYSREQLLRNVWGADCSTGIRSVDVHILWLRKKLANNGLKECIRTVWGVGYSFSSAAVSVME